MKKYLIYYLVLAMFVIGIVPRVEAAFSPSQSLATSSDRANDLERIRVVLEEKLVRQRLQDLGFSADEIGSRISQLSDEQLHTVAQRLDDLRVGKDALGVVVAIAVIVGLVVVVWYLLTHRISIQ